MKHHAGLPDFQLIKRGLDTGEQTLTDEDSELRRLWDVESAALTVLASCRRRLDGALIPTPSTSRALGELEALLQQEEA